MTEQEKEKIEEILLERGLTVEEFEELLDLALAVRREMHEKYKHLRVLSPEELRRTLGSEARKRVSKLLKEGAEIARQVREEVELMQHIPPDVLERPVR